MLWFERRVVATLVDPESDAGLRAAVECYADEALRSMPEYLRAGVAVESVVLGTWARLTGLDGARLAAHVERWQSSPIGPIRQYARLLHSLVLFAEQELAAGPA